MIRWTAMWRLRRARRAARRSDWPKAAARYRQYLRWVPGDGRAWIQLGHALKEAGALQDALRAYEEAASQAAAVPDAWFHLGHTRRLTGARDGAIDAFVEALTIDPAFAPALDAMLVAGARDLLPEEVRRHAENGALGGEAVFATTRYAVYRDILRVPAAPNVAAVLPLVLIDCEGRDEDAATVSEASVAAQSIICKIERWPGAEIPPSGPVVMVEAGTVLHHDAVAWLLAAADRTGAEAIYCDYEEIAPDGVLHPAFQPMHDPVWKRMPDLRAPVMLRSSGGWLRDVGEFPVPAHLPLLLATRHRLPQGMSKALAPGEDEGRIQVIIQTRDQAASLRISVESLRATARLPGKLDIIVVDNRSVDEKTRVLLADWARTGVAETLVLDADFNWSRANNRAARGAASTYLLFLNNDTETLSIGWDDQLRAELADRSVGAVGALLLYPDRSIQHCGITLGLNEGGPLHEGAAQALEPGGPQARWRRSRTAAAVTGAWLAMRREVFDEVGGFDERLAVAFNDVDICLRVRASGRQIVQSAEIVAVHSESLTRGLHLDAREMERNTREFNLLREVWGEALQYDPSYNPHWTRIGCPYDGLRLPAIDEVLAWLDRSASLNPWAVSHPLDKTGEPLA